MNRRTAYKRLWVTAVLAAAALLAGAAAPPCIVRTWQSDEGLPDNTVTGVGQTPDGFLWVATKTGLSRFDGVQFREFPVMSDGAPADRIMLLLADRRGRLWIAKEGGAVFCVEQGRAAAGAFLNSESPAAGCGS
ncbi:MAG: two-component regulator propeller domain-containing protein [bacterium]